MIAGYAYRSLGLNEDGILLSDGLVRLLMIALVTFLSAPRNSPIIKSPNLLTLDLAYPSLASLSGDMFSMPYFEDF